MLTGVLLLGVASLLGGCSSSDMFSAQGAEQWFSKPFTGFKNQDWATPSTATNMSQLREVTPEDFVDASGHCAAAPAEVAPAAAAPGGADLPAAAAVSGGIALTMTECQVVQRAGSPQQVDLGANAGGERTAVLTYTQAVAGHLSFPRRPSRRDRRRGAAGKPKAAPRKAQHRAEDRGAIISHITSFQARVAQESDSRRLFPELHSGSPCFTRRPE